MTAPLVTWPPPTVGSGFGVIAEAATTAATSQLNSDHQPDTPPKAPRDYTPIPDCPINAET